MATDNPEYDEKLLTTTKMSDPHAILVIQTPNKGETNGKSRISKNPN
jgi:hypothetical protein